MPARRAVLFVVLLLVVMGTVVLIGALALRRPAPPASAGTVLVFDVPSTLDEAQPPELPLALGRLRRPRYTLFTLVDALHQAADDDHVKALVLHVDGVDWGWAKLEEVREALRRFRGAHKRVYASLQSGGDAEYYLASAAGLVSMPPTASLELDGLELSALFLRGAFDKFGISPNFAHVGEYKSAVEGYTRTGMSEPSRAALEALLDDVFGTLVDTLAQARGVTPDSVRRLVDDGPYDAAEARARGLVDTLLYDAEVDSLATRAGRRHLSTLTLARYIDRVKGSRTGPHVALVAASGTIAPGRSRVGPDGEWVLGSETLIRGLERARTRHAVRAIVLRIDSPGGDANASDEIWHEVARCRREKPVIVSMSDYAASGGYYIAVAADSIVAQPGSFTGSIGIFGGKFNVSGLLGKIGIGVESVSRGRHAGMMSPFRDFTEEEALRFQRHLEGFYRGFVSKVATQRGRSEAWADSVGRGRVWSGSSARARGLVDGLGGFDLAFRMARARAGLGEDEEIVVERYPEVHRSFLQSVLDDLLSGGDGDDSDELALPEILGAWVRMARFPVGSALALMPFSIRIR